MNGGRDEFCLHTYFNHLVSKRAPIRLIIMLFMHGTQ